MEESGGSEGYIFFAGGFVLLFAAEIAVNLQMDIAVISAICCTAVSPVMKLIKTSITENVNGLA